MMNAIVPYRGVGYALKAARLYRYYRKRYGGSFKYIPYIVKHGKRLARSSAFRSKTKTAISKFSKWKRHQQQQIGQNRFQNSSKKLEVNQLELPLSTYTLYEYNMTNIPQGVNIDDRLRNSVNISGFKICGDIVNENVVPLYFNMAVIKSKNSALSTGSGFFRAAINGERGYDFTRASHTSPFMHCTPINTDRFNILCHMRWTLGGNKDTTAATSNYSSAKSSYLFIDRWLPLKRKLTWDNDAASEPNGGHIMLVYWINKINSGPVLVAETGMANLKLRVYCYFREPKC